jgi:hypothetical protein
MATSAMSYLDISLVEALDGENETTFAPQASPSMQTIRDGTLIGGGELMECSVVVLQTKSPSQHVCMCGRHCGNHPTIPLVSCIFNANCLDVLAP